MVTGESTTIKNDGTGCFWKSGVGLALLTGAIASGIYAHTEAQKELSDSEIIPIYSLDDNKLYLTAGGEILGTSFTTELNRPSRYSLRGMTISFDSYRVAVHSGSGGRDMVSIFHLRDDENPLFVIPEAEHPKFVRNDHGGEDLYVLKPGEPNPDFPNKYISGVYRTEFADGDEFITEELVLDFAEIEAQLDLEESGEFVSYDILDDQLLLVWWDGGHSKLITVNIADGGVAREIPLSHDGMLRDAKFSPDGKIAFITSDPLYTDENGNWDTSEYENGAPGPYVYLFLIDDTNSEPQLVLKEFIPITHGPYRLATYNWLNSKEMIVMRVNRWEKPVTNHQIYNVETKTWRDADINIDFHPMYLNQ